MSLNQNSDISTYLKDIDQVPLLTREEEEKLTKSYGNCCQPHVQANKDYKLCLRCEKIKQKLITANLRFVVSVAKKYQGNALSLPDLINEGNLGLVTSIDKFDYKLGYHLISYAVWWIKQSIMKAISEKSRMIRIPVNRTNDLFRIAKYVDEYSKTNGFMPGKMQISEELQIPVLEIKRIIEMSNGHTSIETLLDDDGECHINSSGNQPDPESISITNSLSSGIENLLQMLPERERFILVKRYGLDNSEKLSLSKIGKLLGLTKERIRQLEKQSLVNLKKMADEKHFDIYFN